MLARSFFLCLFCLCTLSSCLFNKKTLVITQADQKKFFLKDLKKKLFQEIKAFPEPFLLSKALTKKAISNLKLNFLSEELLYAYAPSFKSKTQETFEVLLKKRGKGKKDFSKDIFLQGQVSGIKNKIFKDVSTKSLKSFFKKNRQHFFLETLEVQHIFVKRKSLAKSLLKKINSGKSFSVLAKKHSLSPEGVSHGGKLIISKKTSFPVFKALFNSSSLSSKAFIKKSSFGLHILQVKKKLKKQLSFQESLPYLKDLFLEKKGKKLFEKWLKHALDSFSVRENIPLINSLFLDIKR